MNTASYFSHSKIFFNFFENPWNISPFLMSWYIWGDKKFFKKSKLNIIDREKVF